MQRTGTCLVIGLVSACLLAAIPVAAVPLGYTNSSLKGSYSVLLNKWVSDPNSNAEGFLAVFNFDGAGNLSISSFTDNVAGGITTGSGSGTYSVNADGTGTINASLSDGGTGTFTIVLNGGGKGFQMIMTTCNPGCTTNIISGTGIATEETSFTNKSLKGAFEFLTVKWNENANAVNVVGVATFDGRGNVSASLTADNAGTVMSANASGTYSVNSDGSGSLTLSNNQGYAESFAFALNAKNKGMQLLITSCSGCTESVQTGSATHQ